MFRVATPEYVRTGRSKRKEGAIWKQHGSWDITAVRAVHYAQWNENDHWYPLNIPVLLFIGISVTITATILVTCYLYVL